MVADLSCFALLTLLSLKMRVSLDSPLITNDNLINTYQVDRLCLKLIYDCLAFLFKQEYFFVSPPFYSFIGCCLCHHVFCFQGIKAHGSASLSSRRPLSECVCSDIT